METLKESTINPYEMENFNTRNLEFSGKPRDGALYAEDIQVIFSERVRTKIQSEPTNSHNNRVQKLRNEVNKDGYN